MSDEMALDDGDGGIDISADDIAPPRRAIRPDPDDDDLVTAIGDVRHYPGTGYVVVDVCEKCNAVNEVDPPRGYTIRKASARGVERRDAAETIAVFEHLYDQTRRPRRHTPSLEWVGADDERESPGELFHASYKNRLREARSRHSPFS